MVTDGRMLVQDQDGPADRGRPNKGGPRSRGSSGVGENHTRGCPRLVRALRLQGSQPTDGLGRDRMNAALLKTESFTAVDQPNSLCYSKSAVTSIRGQGQRMKDCGPIKRSPRLIQRLSGLGFPGRKLVTSIKIFP